MQAQIDEALFQQLNQELKLKSTSKLKQKSSERSELLEDLTAKIETMGAEAFKEISSLAQSIEAKVIPDSVPQLQ